MQITYRKISIAMLFVIIIALIYLLLDLKIVKYQSISFSDSMIFNSYAELEKFSPIIVEVEATNESVPYVIQEPSFERKVTKTKVIVDNVIKGELIDGITDDTITVIENFYMQDNGILPGRTIMAYGEYTNLVPGAKYLLHLAWSELREGYWMVTDIGKINLDGMDLLEKQIVERNPNFNLLKTEALASK